MLAYSVLKLIKVYIRERRRSLGDMCPTALYSLTAEDHVGCAISYVYVLCGYSK